jgi:actin-like ATPase involved in cell morphogenesis
MYALGIDLGTTYTAAATWRDGRAQIASLGGRGAAIPSVVLLRSDETFLTGDAANRRGLTEPNRVAREFKRRVGDTTPLMLGGTPYSAEALMSQLLRAVVAEVSTREGGAPSSVCVSHPANWGPYKIDLLRQAVRMADLPSVTYVTEPEAAAVNYAQEQRLGVGAVVAVYDLGGGTFDAAVLRRTATGFTILGQPEGIERLGGIDFDAAVFSHVRTTLGTKLDDLDDDDPAVISAVARLREECVQAKEALSADTDTTIPVLLPSVTTEVRLTRGELESMIRPALHGSIEAMQRAVRSAGLTPEQLHSVLLVGGSSRMPLVGQLVTAELGRPVAVDTHPKHAVALGAARLAGGGFAPPAAAGRGPGGVPAAGVAAAAGAAGLAGLAAASGANGHLGGSGGPTAAFGAGGGVASGRDAGAAGPSAGLGGGTAGGRNAVPAGAPGTAAPADAGSRLGATAPATGFAGPVTTPGMSGHRGGPATGLGGGPTGVRGSGPAGDVPAAFGAAAPGSGSAGGTRSMAGPGGGFGGSAARTRPGPAHHFESRSEAPSRQAEQVAPPPESGRRRALALAGGVVALVLVAGVGIGLVVFGRDDSRPTVPGVTRTSQPSEAPTTPTVTSTTVVPDQPTHKKPPHTKRTTTTESSTSDSSSSVPTTTTDPSIAAPTDSPAP